ncbi:MAG TPA: hypothetical protein VGE18_00180 [Candidatus Paceibacterota bacterium]
MKNIKELKKHGIIASIEYPLPESYMHNGKTLEALVWESLPEKLFSKEDRICYAEAIGRYAARPIITDTFKDHSERREYWSDLSPEVQDALDANRLRISASNNLISMVKMLEYDLPEMYEPFKERAERYTTTLLEYNEWSTEQKIALINELSGFAKEVCVALCAENNC